MAAKTAVKARPQKRIKGKTRPASKARRGGRGTARAELARFRALLLTERDRLEAELQEIGHRTARIDESERAGELSGYEDHPADLASETFEREKDLAIGESVESTLRKVVTALAKIDGGTYGVCDACGRPIKKARLNALPFATLCLNCQDRLER
jgi:RNA polymerase-binding protein DksA